MKILKEHNIEFETINYLKQPPSSKQLKIISELMGFHPNRFIRKREAVYKALNLDVHIDDADYLFEIMSENPVLIERPIAFTTNKAVLGRPPEKVLSIL